MTRILVVDDEPIFHRMIADALEKETYQIDSALSAKDGLQKAKVTPPDLIITDVMMPDMNGYELTCLLRRDPQFANIPILVLSAQNALQSKLSSFEAGADDYLSKPFEPAELVVRLSALLRRSELSKVQVPTVQTQEEARLIAIHSLKGGTGCSSMAINLGVGLYSLWKQPAILLDLNMVAGQIALMLNCTLRRTWADVAQKNAGEIDWDMLQSIIAKHESGVAFIAAPTFPTEAEMIQPDVFDISLSLIRKQYDYVVADLPHDFSDTVVHTLDAADMIIIMAAPDVASVRAASAAIDTYTKLNYPPEKIGLILNATFPRHGLLKDKIEAALGIPVMMVIPNNPDLFVEAINYGRPIVASKPEEPVAVLLENLAFTLSKDTHKKSRPEYPSEAWKRVYKRYLASKK
jgi:pilus assembly protein CpaE